MSATILIADDEPNILISLEFLLKRAGTRSAWRATASKRWTPSSGIGRNWCCST